MYGGSVGMYNVVIVCYGMLCYVMYNVMVCYDVMYNVMVCHDVMCCFVMYKNQSLSACCLLIRVDCLPCVLQLCTWCYSVTGLQQFATVHMMVLQCDSVTM